ncbi:MAG: PepSY domain-containing protein [Planctomycetota bacterium]
MGPKLIHQDAAGKSSKKNSRRLPKRTLNRIIWRWHFWAGLIATPVLMIASLTGGIYIFQPEIEQILFPEILNSKGDSENLTFQQMVDKVVEHEGVGWKPAILFIDDQRKNANRSVFLRGENHQHKTVYIDPYDGEILGQIPEPNFLTVVLRIHRNLFAGMIGRVFMELTTSWMIVLVASGVWLWWPASFRKLKGVLIPRLDAGKYTVARDLHSLSGLFLFPIALVIGITGLLYSLVWGTTFILTGFFSGAFDIEAKPPKSMIPSEQVAKNHSLTADEIYQIALEKKMPLERVNLHLPVSEDDAWSVRSSAGYGPSVEQILFVDRYSGETIFHSTLSEIPLMAQWTQWNYPLHVGSVLGWFSKPIWLLACLVLFSLPVSGIWMWLSRRRKGKTGFPKKYDKKLPRWLILTIAIVAIGLPMVGVSLLVVAIIDFIATRKWFRRRLSSEGIA